HHLRCKYIGAFKARSGKIRFQQPSLVENGSIKFSAHKLRFVEPTGAKNGGGKIEPGEIEARQLFSRKIGRMNRRGGRRHAGDFLTSHLGRGHVWGIEIDITHHVLCRRGPYTSADAKKYCDHPTFHSFDHPDVKICSSSA